VRFVKYHGLGNDFLLVDRLSGPETEAIVGDAAERLCDRRRGIGADGVLTLLPSKVGAARMRIVNADGSLAQMCGNGIRCVAKYLADELLLAGDEVAIETDAGVRACRLLRQDGQVIEVTVDMGAPILEAEKIPINAAPGRFVQQAVQLETFWVRGTAVSMGNPHFVLFGVPPDAAEALGPKLEMHPLFPNRTNVEFVLESGDELQVTVWERGVGITEACGTGACAAVVAGILENRFAAGAERAVLLKGGMLHVRVEPDLCHVWMRGPATRVFAGEIAP
jgi:diaminopimelate epimerase